MASCGAGRPLSREAVARNHALSLKRRPVKAVFGTPKRLYRMGRMRYFSLARNHLAISLACFAYNLRRLNYLHDLNLPAARPDRAKRAAAAGPFRSQAIVRRFREHRL